MKNKNLRILIRAILFSLISGIVVTIIGLLLGWKTSTQFSNGFFWAGAILISLGFMNILGMHSQPADPRMQYSQSVVRTTADERFKFWETDTFRGYHLLAFLGISGALLIGLSGLAILVGRLF